MLILVLLSAVGILAQTNQFSFAALFCGIYPTNLLNDPLPPFPDSSFPANREFVLDVDGNTSTDFKLRIIYDSTYGNDSDFGDPSGIEKVEIAGVGNWIFGPANATSYNKIQELDILYIPFQTPTLLNINVTLTRPFPDATFSIKLPCPITVKINPIFAAPPALPYTINGTFVYSNWSSCDRACGTGFQTRTVQCILNGTEVDSYLCPNESQRLPLIQTCNTRNCTTNYYRQWDYFTYRCNNLCGGGTYHLRMPTPGCRIGGTDDYINATCDNSTFPNMSISSLCPAPTSPCGWVYEPYPTCVNGTNVTRWYECRNGDGVRFTPDDCLFAGITRNFSISRACIGDAIIDKEIQTINIYTGYQITIHGENFSPFLDDNWSTFFTENGTEINPISHQIVNVSSDGKIAILNLNNGFLSNYFASVDQPVVSIQWWNGNANGSQLTPFMKLVRSGSLKIYPGFVTFLFLLSLFFFV